MKHKSARIMQTPPEVSPELKALADMVNSPNHYTQGGKADVEVIDIIAALPMCRGSAVRYLCRAGLKDPQAEIQDLEKAAKYIEFEIRRLKGEPISDSLRAFIKFDK